MSIRQHRQNFSVNCSCIRSCSFPEAKSKLWKLVSSKCHYGEEISPARQIKVFLAIILTNYGSQGAHKWDVIPVLYIGHYQSNEDLELIKRHKIR